MLSDIITFLNEVPDHTYPGVYVKSEDHNVLSPIFWWREMWHAIGGIVFGVALFWIPHALIIAPSATYLVMLLKEFVNDVQDQGGVPDFKNFVDPLAFAIGCFLTAYLIRLI